MNDIPIPRGIHREDHQITITWGDRDVCVYGARDLRLRCHCAVCREELTGQPLLDPATVPDDVRPMAITLVGSYAIQIAWSDGHNTGIYTYKYLRSLCGETPAAD